MSSPSRPPAVAIIGGGISGLAAAFFLRDHGVAVTVLEGSPRLGGKLAVSEVGGVAVDEGAEALLARRPEGTDLIGAVGLAGLLNCPAPPPRGSGPGAVCTPCQNASSWACPQTWANCRAPGFFRMPGWPGRATTCGCRQRRETVTCRWAATLARDSARKSWAASWTRCSAASTRAAPASCRSRRRLAAWRRRHGSTARWPRRPRPCCPHPGDRAARPPPPARSSPRCPAVSARCRPRWRRSRARPCTPARWSVSWPARRVRTGRAGGSPSARPGRRNGSTPMPSSSRSRPGPPAGCWPRLPTRQRPPRPSARSSTRAWRS